MEGGYADAGLWSNGKLRNYLRPPKTPGKPAKSSQLIHKVIYLFRAKSFQNQSFQPLDAQDLLTDAALCGALSEMEKGLIDADLGGSVVKKRVPLPGRGKSGSARTLVATNKGNRWFFLFGFQKNERANVSPKELEALRAIAADLLKLSSAELDAHVVSEAMQEICHDHQD